MRNTITRTITETQLKVCRIEFRDGNPIAVDLPDIRVFGEVSDAAARKIAAKEYGKTDVIMVKEKAVFDTTFEITVEDFVKYATRVE